MPAPKAQMIEVKLDEASHLVNFSCPSDWLIQSIIFWIVALSRFNPF